MNKILKKVIIVVIFILLPILILAYYFDTQRTPMAVFNKFQDDSTEEFQIFFNKSKEDYQKYKQNSQKYKTDKVVMNLYNLRPPKNSYISVYSYNSDKVVYMGPYKQQIELNIHPSFYEIQSGRDFLKFIVYEPDTLTTYVTSHKFSYFVWQKNKDINIKFLSKQGWENREIINFRVELNDRKNK